jgi:membrane protein implicated in regulation of membrane protease activity
MISKLLLVLGFLVVWIGALVIYAGSTSAGPKESGLITISVICVVAYLFIVRLFRKRKTGVADASSGVLHGQMMAGEHLEEGSDSGGYDSDFE